MKWRLALLLAVFLCGLALAQTRGGPRSSPYTCTTCTAESYTSTRQNAETIDAGALRATNIDAGHINAVGVDAGVMRATQIIAGSVDAGVFAFGDGSYQTRAQNLWSLSNKPLTPHAYDDEFETTSVSSWTSGGNIVGEVNPYTTVTVSGDLRRSVSTARLGWVLFQPSNNATYIDALHKAITIPADFLIWVRMSRNRRQATVPVNNDQGIGFRISASSGGAPDANNSVSLFLQESDGLGSAQLQWNKTEAGVDDSSTLNIADITSADLQYLAMQKIGLNFYYWVAGESGNWIYLGTKAIGSGTASSLDRVTIVVANAATTAPGNAIVGLDFIRFKASADYLP